MARETLEGGGGWSNPTGERVPWGRTVRNPLREYNDLLKTRRRRLCGIKTQRHRVGSRDDTSGKGIFIEVGLGRLGFVLYGRFVWTGLGRAMGC